MNSQSFKSSHISSSLQNPLDNPNKGQNRVPTQGELATLLNLRLDKRQLAATLDSQLAKANDAHARIQSRYDTLLLEIEGVKSELYASRSHILSLEKQRETLQTEDNELSGLLHPIRRCPEDVLRIIFELTTEEAERLYGIGLRMASSIASVCKNWRRIALQAGELWRHVHLFGISSQEVRKRRLELVHSRIRLAPAIVWIGHLSHTFNGTLTSFVEDIDIGRFKNIGVLRIDFENAEQARNLLSSEIWPLGSTQCLSIRSPVDSEINGTWNLSRLLSQGPRVRKVTLDSVGEVGFVGDEVIPTLQELRLKKVSIPSLPGHLHRLLGLRTLSIRDKIFNFNPLAVDINLPMLNDLYIDKARNFPWKKLTAPNLQALRGGFVGEGDSVDLFEFIIRHGGLLHTVVFHGLWLNKSQGKQVAVALTRVQQLGLCVPITCFTERIDDKLPFPNLVNLEYVVEPGATTTQEQFDNFVSVRCKVSQSPVPEEIKPLISFAIFGPKKSLEGLRWQNGPLGLTCEHRSEPQSGRFLKLVFQLRK